VSIRTAVFLVVVKECEMVATLEKKAQNLPPKTRGNFSSSPLLVFYEVTQACDLVCQHCRACAQQTADAAELTTALSLRLIDQLAQFPTPPMLVLTGGDPLKRTDIFQLIEHAAWLGIDVSITPSATSLVSPQAIRRLRDAGVSRMAISIDGADAATHDATRGVVGSFDRSLQILAEASAAGLPLQVNTTLTPSNVAQIARMAELFARLEIVMWSVFFLVPVGRARDLPRLHAAECESAFADLWREAQRQPFAVKTTEAPHYRRFVIQHQLAKTSSRSAHASPAGYVPLGVNDGKGVMFISHSGLIHPSGFVPIACGVYPMQHVVQVYQDSPIFRALRDTDRLEGKCGDCEFRHLCGGSRARAFAVTGNLFAEEPDCDYVPRKTSSA
jgi:radical SAM protein